jgi:hypothetical protein
VLRDQVQTHTVADEDPTQPTTFISASEKMYRNGVNGSCAFRGRPLWRDFWVLRLTPQLLQLVLFFGLFSQPSAAWSTGPFLTVPRARIRVHLLVSSSPAVDEYRPCFYRLPVPGDSQNDASTFGQRRPYWTRRIDFDDLYVGQQLRNCWVVSEKLVGTRTGPKLWLETGVGKQQKQGPQQNAPESKQKWKNNAKWSIVYGMLRLGGPNIKESVIRKKVLKIKLLSEQPPPRASDQLSVQHTATSGKSGQVKQLNKNRFAAGTGLTVYVSRIFRANKSFEVSLDPPSAPFPTLATVSSSMSSLPAKHILWSSLVPGRTGLGKIVRVEDYGLLVRWQEDIAEASSKNVKAVFSGAEDGLTAETTRTAARLGLIPIQKVADLHDCYVNKADGLIDLGYTIGSVVKVCVAERRHKRLLFDFSTEVYSQFLDEGSCNSEVAGEGKSNVMSNIVPDDGVSSSAVFNTSFSAPSVEADDSEYDDEDYDEDRAIEDALGLGSY